MSYHAIWQLTKQEELNVKNTYIQIILKSSEKLATKVNVLEFENKGLVKALKVEKQKRNRDKWLVLLSAKNNGSQLFSSLRIRAAQEFAAQKKPKRVAQKKYRKKKRRAAKKKGTKKD